MTIQPCTQSRVVFFVRTFNDIDHLTPLADYYANNGNYRVDVYCLEWETCLDKNPNIQHLRRIPTCRVTYLWQRLGKDGSIVNGLVVEVIHRLRLVEERLDQSSIRGRVWSLGKKFVNKCLQLSYAFLNVGQVFGQIKPEVMVFDYLNAGALRNRKLVRMAKKKRILTVCLPHGILMYSNRNFTAKQHLTVDSKGYSFDYYLGGGLVRNYLEDRGIPPNKIVELGSLRYCDTWLKEYRNKVVREKYERNDTSDVCRIVCFLMQSAYMVDDDALVETIVKIGELEGFQLVIKPHPRGMDLKALQNAIESTNIVIDSNTSSLSLISWSDIGIAYGSSIALQILLDGKTLIYPSYLDTNTMFVADRNACWTVNDIDGLEKALKTVRRKFRYKTYSDDNVRKFLDDIVYAGDESRRCVIEKHFEFIQNCVDKN